MFPNMTLSKLSHVYENLSFLEALLQSESLKELMLVWLSAKQCQVPYGISKTTPPMS